MIRPNELKLVLLVELFNSVRATTTQVWNMLVASKEGDLETVKRLAEECPELLFSQYNYTPPIHFAVREGHVSLVKYLLEKGAYDVHYRTYPFLDTLTTLAEDREFAEIVRLLNDYSGNEKLQNFYGDNGKIHFNRTTTQIEFENAVENNDLGKTEDILKQYPEFAKDETFFWGEGILLFAVKENNQPMIDLLIEYGAKVPDILKWTQFYYFEKEDAAAYILKKGMNPNTMNWHHVTILHDMAQKGFINKAEMLINYGADLNPVEEEYQSTPLGLASRWRHQEMVAFLLSKGADPNKSGAPWATPLAWARKREFHEIELLLIKAGVHL